MAQATSGQVLREARERKGYDLNTVARRLRIRPDILRAIEAGDFAAMPPRGYTRNMVNAYAKLLGLNPTEIVNLYLDEAYAEQVERARDTAPSSGFNMQRETRRSRSQLGVGEDSGAETRAIHPIETNDGGTRQFSRVLYDDSTRFSRDDYGVTRQRAERPGKSERDFSSHHSGYDSSSSNYGASNEPRRGKRSIYAGQTPMQYSASRLPAFLQSRAALIALGVAIAAILIVVLVVVIGNVTRPKADDVSSLPVSGISDTTGTEESSAATPVEVAPTSARATYTVKSGEECYIEVYENGTMTPETLTGPTEKTVNVTGTWTITTWAPEALTLTVDGEKAELKVSQEYGGMYAYTVDFAQILQKWNAAHGISSSAASASTSGTSNKTSSTQNASTNSRDDGTNYDDSNDPQSGLTTQSDEDEYYDEDAENQEGENYDEYYEEGYDESQDGYYDDSYYDESYDGGEEYYEEDYQQ